MTEAREPSSEGVPSGFAGLVSGGPLFLLALVLFVGALLTSRGAVVLLPGRIPLWILLFATGLIAAAGGLVAFFFAAEDRPETETAPSASASEAHSDLGAGRERFGRPRPEVVVSRPPEEPWRETWPDDTPEGIASAAVSASPNEPEPPFNPANYDEVLAELDAIQREVSRLKRQTKAVSR